MEFYKFIKIKGEGGSRTGYFVPRMYQLVGVRNGLKVFGLQYIKERLTGWTIWWVQNEEDYVQAIRTLNELRKTRIFEYKVSN